MWSLSKETRIYSTERALTLLIVRSTAKALPFRWSIDHFLSGFFFYFDSFRQIGFQREFRVRGTSAVWKIERCLFMQLVAFVRFFFAFIIYVCAFAVFLDFLTRQLWLVLRRFFSIVRTSSCNIFATFYLAIGWFCLAAHYDLVIELNFLSSIKIYCIF